MTNCSPKVQLLEARTSQTYHVLQTVLTVPKKTNIANISHVMSTSRMCQSKPRKGFLCIPGALPEFIDLGLQCSPVLLVGHAL